MINIVFVYVNFVKLSCLKKDVISLFFEFFIQTFETLSIWISVPVAKLLEAEFKEFEPRLKFKPGLKYGWFHLKFY